MLARLSFVYGWRWKKDDGTWGPFILTDIERYAGMIAGRAPNGRICTRPISEYDAVSEDGIEWRPVKDLVEMGNNAQPSVHVSEPDRTGAGHLPGPLGNRVHGSRRNRNRNGATSMTKPVLKTVADLREYLDHLEDAEALDQDTLLATRGALGITIPGTLYGWMDNGVLVLG